MLKSRLFIHATLNFVPRHDVCSSRLQMLTSPSGAWKSDSAFKAWRFYYWITLQQTQSSLLLLPFFCRGRRPHISHAALGNNQLRSDSIMKEDQYIQIFVRVCVWVRWSPVIVDISKPLFPALIWGMFWWWKKEKMCEENIRHTAESLNMHVDVGPGCQQGNFNPDQALILFLLMTLHSAILCIWLTYSVPF